MRRSTEKMRRWNKETIVVEAERLADEVGFHNLSMVQLAARIGVKPPSLYKHFASLADLRVALQMRAVDGLSDVLLQAVAGRSGRSAIIAGAHAYRAYLVAHAGARGAVASAIPKDADAAMREVLQHHQERWVQVSSNVLIAEGFEETQAIHALRGLRSLIHGFVHLEAQGAFQIAIPTQDSFAWLLERYLDGIGLAARPPPQVRTTALA